MPERHRILIVDDYADDRQAIVQALRRASAQFDGVEADVLELDTIAGAREAITREEFSCIFLDHDLPDGTSLDLLMEVRVQGLVTPVIVLTGLRDEQAVAEVIRAGAVDYLPKEKLHPDMVARSLRAALHFMKAQRELHEAHQQTVSILEGMTDAFFILDAEWRFTYLNAQAERLLARVRAELLGRNVWEEFPAAVGSDFEEQYRRAVAEQIAVTFEAYYPPPLDTWFEVRAYPSAGGLSVYFHDITEWVGRLHRKRFLAELAERARAFTDPDDVIADAVHSVGEFFAVERCVFVDIDIEADTCTTHPDYRAGDFVTSMAGVSPISAFGQVVIAEYGAGRTVVVEDVHLDRAQVPEGNVAAYDALGIRAHVGVPVVHSSQLVSVLGVHSATPRHWLPEEVALFQAVVERTWLTVEVLRQQRALTRGAEITARILESITDAFFTLDRDWRITRVNDQAERLMTRKRDEILGRNYLEVFPRLIGSTYEREYRRAVAEGVSVSFEEFYPPLDAWLEIRAYPSADGLSVFYQDVTVRKRAEADREKLLAEQQKLAERETILNRIGQVIRSALGSEAVQEEAVNLLGEALGADRCYFALYDLERGIVNIGRDWHSGGLPSVQGVYPFPNTVEMFQELYHGSDTSVVTDAYTAPLSAQTRTNMERLQLRARVSVALADGNGLMATLTAAMADGPRDWTAEEVSLVQAVGTQLRTAVEAARVQQRERTIAQQLQEALQPALPAHITGLSLGSFTQPALNEASVGGDFFDVFALDKEQYALVIGDVSGKGLAAAQQLALIRNSLRTTLYLYRSPAQAVTSLNAIVSTHDLLVGFVTAWVGVYDATTGQITYASCGHEPGLVRRVGGTKKEVAEELRVEELQTTGPPLGIAQNAEYSELTVTLSSGDALLLYTDGISEAGPSRRELLATTGLKRMLVALPEDVDAQAQAENLVAKVSSYAGGIFRDDVAVLLACRQ